MFGISWGGFLLDVGDVAEKIVNFAKANQTGLIIMSMHGHTGLRKLVPTVSASERVADQL